MSLLNVGVADFAAGGCAPTRADASPTAAHSAAAATVVRIIIREAPLIAEPRRGSVDGTESLRLRSRLLTAARAHWFPRLRSDPPSEPRHVSRGVRAREPLPPLAAAALAFAAPAFALS